MRVVGGRLRGRALASPSSGEIRPTADRLREALFNVLAHSFDDPVPGARVLDLFSGTGALAIEALSRGAAFAVLVDQGADARGLMRQNVESLGLGGVTRIFRRDATQLGPIGPSLPFDLAFCDPPYRRNLAPAALASARGGGWLAPGGLAIVEEDVAAGFSPPAGFTTLERRRYGDTEFVFTRLDPAG